MKFYLRRSGHVVSPLAKGLLVSLPLLMAALLLLTTACSRRSQPTSTIVIAKGISPKPPRVGPITVTFRLIAADKPVTGAHSALEGDMTHAGMAPVFGETREIAPGQYQGQLLLNMGGDWVVLIHTTLPDGKQLEDEVAVSGVQSQ